MPIYEYQCVQCGKRTEKIQSVNDPPLKDCASCGGRLERVISPPAIQFKGSGWYVTDYARKSTPAGNGKGTPEETKGKADTKQPKETGSKSEDTKPAGSKKNQKTE